ncbi:uncharacterized protein LOC107465085 [Arachis duranensis]|uniref:Uncharacterized protein LOC107465085 n=1 Tax=Arachis duranensis TaxID=130453 RepID=A0A6P4BBH6_ARADU|nr:uncharacterized protein LOC107465085 [Arachis duranensis]
MASNNLFTIVLVYPNCRMRNGDNGVTFECQDPILFRTQRVETLSDLKNLILSKLGDTQAREVGRVGYRLLAPMENGVFRFRLFRLHGDEHVRLMFDIHGRIMCEQVMELSAKGEEESDEDYVADSADSESSDGGDEDEFVPETPAGVVPRHVLPPPHPIPALSAMPSDYHSLDLDAMHERIPVSDTCGVDYNLNGGVEFQVGHRFRSREAVIQGVKNYSIRRSVEYRVIESDREVRRFGGPHSCLAPTMSQDHRQLDSSRICIVILPLIQSNPSVTIPVLQGVVQALLSCFSGTICDLRVKPYYEGHLMGRDCCMFDKVFWDFPSYVEAFKHCKPFVSVDDMHLYGKYGGVCLLRWRKTETATYNNILPWEAWRRGVAPPTPTSPYGITYQSQGGSPRRGYRVRVGLGDTPRPAR